MKLAEISVRRPVFASVLSLLILLIGAVSYSKLTVREYPRIDEPVVTVSTRLAGASSDVIESQITKPLEDSVAGIDGVDVISSISRAEQSQITVKFNLDKAPEAAAADVRDRVSRVRGRLPDAADEPVISKVEADASPTIWLAFTSDKHSQLELTDIVNQIAKPRVQMVSGVADVSVPGERKAAMRIWLDPDRLAAYSLTVQDVEDALRKQNLEVPAGRIENTQREFTVTARTDLNTPEDFAQVVLRTGSTASTTSTVKLGDVARIEIGAASERNSVRLNGKQAVGLGLIRQATANPLELSDAVRAALPKLEQDLPDGVSVEIANDNSVFIDRSVKAVYSTILEAVVLVALVVFVFLRTIRASIIPLITIPVSLVGTFALMALAGFSINTLTLLAMVLAIGLVVDDAIVVLENIHRHIEEGMKPFDAAIKGSKEIAFAVVAMTLTLAAVFAPLAFTPGRTGRLFIEFALTLAGAVVVSGFVALTLSPMMCSKLLKHHQPNRFDRWVEGGLNRVTSVYQGVLSYALSHRWIIMGIMVAAGGACTWLYLNTKSELAPVEDRGVVLATVNAPDGSTLAWTQRYLESIEGIASDYPEFDRVFVVAGNPSVSQGIAFLRTTDWELRHRSTQELTKLLQPRFQALAGVTAFPITPPSLGQSARSRPISYVITTSNSYEELAGVMRSLQSEIAKNPGFVQPDSDLRLNKPELYVSVDRDRAADSGVSVDQVARTIETMLGGRTVTRFKRDSDQFDVIVQTDASGRMTPQDIEKLFVRGRNNAMVPLSSLVTVKESVAPRELNHFNQRRSATLTANLAPGYSLGEALQFLDATAAKTLPTGYATELNEISREYKTSSGALGTVFALALVFIFLVLAAQFESFIDPFVILISVPLSMVGALLALKWTGGTLNVYSQIGLITLVGLITKHGILIVEFANQLRREGMAAIDAVQQAAALRLRPILMTTAAMVLGAIPLALATGAGAESRRQIGAVIVGGMTLGTLLTLLVVPTVYTWLARRRPSGPRLDEATSATAIEPQA